MSGSPRGSIIIDAKLLRQSPLCSPQPSRLIIGTNAAAVDSISDECTGAPLNDSAGTRDLATLANLTEETIVRELGRRYQQNIIYTNVGDILIALNPFKELDGLYG